MCQAYDICKLHEDRQLSVVAISQGTFAVQKSLHSKLKPLPTHEMLEHSRSLFAHLQSPLPRSVFEPDSRENCLHSSKALW